MINNVSIGAINCAQYANLLCLAAIRTNGKTYLCKGRQLYAHGLFAGNQKHELQDPNFTALSFREITIYTLHYKGDLRQDTSLRPRVRRSLQELVENKERSLQQKNLFIRVIEQILDFFYNWRAGFGFISTLSLARNLLCDLQPEELPAGSSPAAPSPQRPPSALHHNLHARAPAGQTPPPTAPSSLAVQAVSSSSTSQQVSPAPTRSSIAAQVARYSNTPSQLNGQTEIFASQRSGSNTESPSGTRVRGRTTQMNSFIRENALPEVTTLDGEAANPNRRAAARRNYLMNVASSHDLFLIFQNITSIEIEGRPLRSIVGLMLELSGLPAVDLNHDICQRVIVDAFKECNDNTSEALVDWLKVKNLPGELVNNCLSAFIYRHQNAKPISLHAVVELLLYANSHHIQVGIAERQILNIIFSIDPNFHRFDRIRELYDA